MKMKVIATLPNNIEVERWFIDNIGTDNDCSASSAIFKFRQWLNDRGSLKEDGGHINYGTLVNPDSAYPVVYTRRQDGTKEFEPRYLKGKDLTQPQIKYLYDIGYFDQS